MKNKLFFLSLVLVLFLSWQYLPRKTLGLAEIPKATDILDEKNYVWAAKSFWQTGIPTAWSNLDAYKVGIEGRKGIGFEDLSITFQGEKPSLKNREKFDYPVAAVEEIDVGKGKEQILFVQPFFDHSFLAGLVYGLKTPNNISSFVEVRSEDYRLMAVYVSLLSGLLLFLLTFLLYGHPMTALLAFLIYSTVGVYLLVSRYALIENILVPLTLLSLVFLALSKQPWVKKDYQKKIFWVLGGIGAGLALTTKEMGVAVLIAGVLIMLSRKIPWKNLLYFFLPAVIVGSLFYLYAFWLEPKLFSEIFFNQVNRGFFGPLNFLYAFYRPHFAGFPLEGWWIFGFLALLFLAKEFEKNREIILAFLSFLFVFVFFGGLNYPWYSLIFIPFLVIASAVFLKELIFKPTIAKIIVFFLLPFSSTLYWGHNVFHKMGVNVLVYRLFIFVFLGLAILSLFKKKASFLGTIMSLIILMVLWKTYQWNVRGFEYWIANWGKLP